MVFRVWDLVLTCYRYIISIFNMVVINNFLRISVFQSGSNGRPTTKSHQRPKEPHSLKVSCVYDDFLPVKSWFLIFFASAIPRIWIGSFSLWAVANFLLEISISFFHHWKELRILHRYSLSAFSPEPSRFFGAARKSVRPPSERSLSNRLHIINVYRKISLAIPNI